VLILNFIDIRTVTAKCIIDDFYSKQTRTAVPKPEKTTNPTPLIHKLKLVIRKLTRNDSQFRMTCKHVTHLAPFYAVLLANQTDSYIAGRSEPKTYPVLFSAGCTTMLSHANPIATKV
jgi:hypothetical protein